MTIELTDEDAENLKPAVYIITKRLIEAGNYKQARLFATLGSKLTNDKGFAFLETMLNVANEARDTIKDTQTAK